MDRQPRWLPSERWLPGACVSAGGATTGGEKLFGPPGVMFFSVGDGRRPADVVVVVVVVDGRRLLAGAAASGQRAHRDDRAPAGNQRQSTGETT